MHKSQKVYPFEKWVCVCVCVGGGGGGGGGRYFYVHVYLNMIEAIQLSYLKR